MTTITFRGKTYEIVADTPLLGCEACAFRTNIGCGRASKEHPSDSSSCIVGGHHYVEQVSDLKLVTALLTHLGIVYHMDELSDRVEVGIHEGAGLLNKGYSDFYTVFEFTLSGKFTEVGAWE